MSLRILLITLLIVYNILTMKMAKKLLWPAYFFIPFLLVNYSESKL